MPLYRTVKRVYNKEIERKGGRAMRPTESREDYLETILLLNQETGYVRSIDVAERLGVTKPSVSRATSLLKEARLLEMDPRDGALTLTEAGQALAEQVYERHRTLTRLLEKIGVSSETAAQDACRIEHVISEESMTTIRNFLEEQA